MLALVQLGTQGVRTSSAEVDNFEVRAEKPHEVHKVHEVESVVMSPK